MSQKKAQRQTCSTYSIMRAERTKNNANNKKIGNTRKKNINEQLKTKKCRLTNIYRISMKLLLLANRDPD